MPPGQDQDPFLQEFSERSIDLKKWLSVLLEHRWLIIGFTTLTIVLAALYCFLATPIYSATATVYVQSHTQQPIGSQSFIGVASWMEEEKFYNSQAHIITSRAVAQEVVDRLKLHEHPHFRGSGNPAQQFRGMIRVEKIRDSALFNISVRSSYREDVALWANTVAEVYADMSIKNALDYITKANKLMIDQTERMQEEYSRQKKMFTGALAEAGSYFPENQIEIIDKRIEALELKLGELRVQQSQVGAQISQMETWSSRGGNPLGLPSVAQDETARQIITHYNDVDRQLGQLQVRLTDNHPDVKKKKAERDALRSKLWSQTQMILASYRNRYQALQTEEASLQEELASLKSQALSFAEGSASGETMKTSAAAIKKYMDLLYDKMREMNVSGNLLNNNIRIVNSALTPGRPVRPNTKRNLILAFILGMVLSIGSIITVNILDTTVKSVDDVEQGLGLNLLSMIPTIEDDTERATVESFQTLRTALVYASRNKQRNIILVTSANPKEGKSSVVSNLANITASAGDRVILMDCDLRRPSLHRYMNVERNQRGLTHYLADPSSKVEDFIVTGNRPNLSVIFSGPIPPNPPELFSMQRFKDLVKRLREEYDWVLIDSPPCLSITDAQILASLADLLLIVARYKKTPLPSIHRAVIMLQRMNAQLAGVVLNDVESHSSYYYDYYYSSHYYYYDSVARRRKPSFLKKAEKWKAKIEKLKKSSKG